MGQGLCTQTSPHPGEQGSSTEGWPTLLSMPPQTRTGHWGLDRRHGVEGCEQGALAQGAVKKVGQVFLGLRRNSCYKFIMA